MYVYLILYYMFLETLEKYGKKLVIFHLEKSVKFFSWSRKRK